MIYELETCDAERFPKTKWTSHANYQAGDAKWHAVVVASSEEEARRMACTYCGDEGEEAWMHETTIVTMIDPNGRPRRLA